MLNLYDKMVMDASGVGQGTKEPKRYFKHLGVLASDNAPVVIIFKTVPKEPNNCLVIGPNFLNLNYKDALMRVLESSDGQAAFDLGNALAKCNFPGDVNMLAFLHEENYIKKMPTKDITVTYGPDKNGRISLDKLNELIADDMKISLEDLSVREDKPKNRNTKNKKNGKEAAKN